jgi:hypothetical protein
VFVLAYKVGQGREALNKVADGESSALRIAGTHK